MLGRNQAVDVVEEDAPDLAEANTIIKRLADDADLREAVGRALKSSRAVYDKVSHTKKASKLMEDAKLQADAVTALDAIRAVKESLAVAAETSARKRRTGGLGTKLLVLAVGGVVALVASASLRSKVLDALFGAEEEFEYSPPPPAAGDAPGSPLSAV